MFTDLIDEDGQAVQANQFLIVDHGMGAVIDPGGTIAFNELYLALSHYFPPQNLSYLIASHADPDIIASLDRWLTSTHATLVISQLWARFAPHFTKSGKLTNRVLPVPDLGGRLPLGKSELWLVPAHFMHAEGNFHFYDPISRILFTGDLGVSLTDGPFRVWLVAICACGAYRRAAGGRPGRIGCELLRSGYGTARLS